VELWGIEPQTSALPGRPGLGLSEKTAEKQGVHDERSTPVQPVLSGSAHCETIDTDICDDTDVCDDIAHDPVEEILADALLRAVTSCDYATADRVASKLDDWRRGRT
jgi:hypothetical protein